MLFPKNLNSVCYVHVVSITVEYCNGAVVNGNVVAMEVVEWAKTKRDVCASWAIMAD